MSVASILKKTVFASTFAAACILLLVSLLLAVGIYKLHSDVVRLTQKVELADGQFAAKDTQAYSMQLELEGKDALLEQKDEEWASILRTLNLSSERETSIVEEYSRLQGMNQELSRKLNATILERDQCVLQAENYSGESSSWEQRYNSLLSQYNQEKSTRAAESLLCEYIVVDVSPDNPGVSTDYTLTFRYGDGKPASGLPVFVLSTYEYNYSMSNTRRFYLTDGAGRIFGEGKSNSFKGSGEVTIILNCEQTMHLMRFRLYSRTEPLGNQEYKITRIDFTNTK